MVKVSIRPVEKHGGLRRMASSTLAKAPCWQAWVVPLSGSQGPELETGIPGFHHYYFLEQLFVNLDKPKELDYKYLVT